MYFSNLFKQLKRRLRMRKRWLSLGMFLLAAGALAAGVWMGADGPGPGPEPDGQAVQAVGRGLDVNGDEAASASKETMEKIRSSNEIRDVFLKKRYVCGEETEHAGKLSPDDIAKLYLDHVGAKLELDPEGSVILTEEVEELAPKCKDNAYFGMDKNGNLSLFEGLPEQDRVIRTFFQLDVQHLKSSLPQEAVNQLYSGIRITDLADYNSVLSTFTEYAADAAEPAAGHKP